jgi:hypothetical protein
MIMAKDIKKFAHPDYLCNLPDYQRLRDCFKGERAIKEAGICYLPKLKAQSLEDYDNYKLRALFFPITGKTVSSMIGMATAKPPKIDYPELLESYFKDSSENYQFTEFYMSVFTEVTLMSRYGVLIDAPRQEGEPTLVPYIAENIINWDHDEKGKLTMLLLREHRRVPTGEKFESVYQCVYRHCYVNQGLYTVEVLDEDLELIEGPIYPQFSGENIDYIPWTPFSASGVHMQVDKSAMLDIATINVSHYLTSADLEWGRHMVGLPTPVVSGVDSSTHLHIGGTSAWILPPPEAKAYFLEFLGEGLTSLEKAMTEKVALMASISARMIDNSARGSESPETVKLRYMSETASLIHIISSVETGLVLMYNMLARLKKVNGEVMIKIPRDILGAGITFKDLSILFEAYLNNSISKESLLYNLRRLDALDPNRTDDQELSSIKAPPAKTIPAATTNVSTTQN